MREEGRQQIGSKVWIGVTLETSSEGGRQRLGAGWNSERLCKGPVLEREQKKDVYQPLGEEEGGICGLLGEFWRVLL